VESTLQDEKQRVVTKSTPDAVQKDTPLNKALSEKMADEFTETNELLSEICGLFTYKKVQDFTWECTRQNKDKPSLTSSAQKPRKAPNYFPKVKSIFQKNLLDALSKKQSQSGVSEHPDLASLIELSSCFPDQDPSDFEVKLKFFTQVKLPFLYIDIQPKEISKLLLILSNIIMSNALPKTKFKLVTREKEILSDIVLMKLRKTLNPR
jgi:hypothetical protein